MTTVHQPTFSRGEVSPALVGRVDLALYGSALAKCKNFVVYPQGGIRNRQGTRMVAPAKSNYSTVRLIPFTFNSEQSYVLEVGMTNSGTSYMRVHTHGSTVVYQTNTAGTYGTTFELTGLPWKALEIPELKFSQSADAITVTHAKYSPQQIVRYDHDKWGIVAIDFSTGPFQPMNSNTSLTVYASSPTGTPNITIKASSPIFEPKNSGLLFRMEPKDFGKSWEPGKTVATGDIRRSDGKYYVVVSGTKTGTMRPTQTEGTWVDGSDTDAVEWRFLHPGHGVCRLGTITTATDTVTASVITRIPDSIATGSSSAYENYTIGSVSVSTTGYDPIVVDVGPNNLPTTGPFECTVVVNFLNAYGGEVTVSQASTGVMIGTTQVQVGIPSELFGWYSSLDPAKASTVSYRAVGAQSTDTHRWAFGSWGAGPQYPSCCSYFQQRQCFAGSPTQPQTVWMSRTNSYLDFSESSPIQDDDSLGYTLASSQIDYINNLLPLDKLIIFTLGGNWVTGSGQSEAVTPANISAKPQSAYGSSAVHPLSVGNSAIYYGKGGTVREIGYEFASDSYTGNDLTVMSQHLLENHRIVDWAFQQSPFPVIWAVRDDGILLGLTYMKEQGVVGWHQHDLGGTVESVCVINECSEDHLYLVVSRPFGKFIEVMYPRCDDEYESYFLDCGGTYDGRNTNPLHRVRVTLTGGTWVAGSTVAIDYDAADGTTMFQYPESGIVGGIPQNDNYDHVVLQAADGTLHRINFITSVGGSKIKAFGSLMSDLPADLQGVWTDNWAWARRYLSDLSYAVGQTFGVYSDGVYAGTAAVDGDGVLQVPLAVYPGMVISVGKLITSDAQTLPIMIPGQGGPALDKKKLVTSLRLLLDKSVACQVGPDELHLDRVTLGTLQDQKSIGHHSGVLEAHIPAAWNRSGSVFIRHAEPYPLSIIGAMPDVVMEAPRG